MDNSELSKQLEAFFLCLDNNPNNPGICIDNKYAKAVEAIIKIRQNQGKTEDIINATNEIIANKDIYLKVPEYINPDELNNKDKLNYAIFRAKEDHVKDLLNEYVNSWVWEIEKGKFIYIPYYINDETDKAHKKRETEDGKEILEKIKIYQEAWINDENETKEQNQYYTSSEKQVDGNILGGKGGAAMIKYVMKKLVDDQDVNVTVDNLQSIMNRKYNENGTEKYGLGIGIDCSGFVSRGLATVFDKLGILIVDQIKSLGEAKKNSGQLKTNATTLAPQDSIINYKEFKQGCIKKKGVIIDYYAILKKKGEIKKNLIIENLKNIGVGDVIVSVKADKKSQTKINSNNVVFYMGTEKNSKDKDITFYTLDHQDWNNENKRIKFFYHIRIICEVKRDMDGKLRSFSYAESTSEAFPKTIDNQELKNVTGVKVTTDQTTINKNYAIVRPYALRKFYNFYNENENKKK